MARDNAEKSGGRTIAFSLLLIESILVLALGIYMIALGFTHDKSWMPYLSVIGFSFAGSGALYTLAWGVKNGRRWANSPAILANLIALGVAKYQFEAGVYWLAIPIAAMAVTVTASIFITVKKSAK
ncbi:MAG: hypothetical protein F2803_06395 [Actinobacteria bacterium]|nr:hypothetical protein [Actinomycetota bacterium]